jgi:hypothetical protein
VAEKGGWPVRALNILVPLTLVILLAQYFLGLWTNIYAPATGFTSNTSFPSLDWHYNLGFALGVLGILLVIVTGFTRNLGFLALGAVALLGIIVAGLAGGQFVSTNNPLFSFDMGAGFIIAFAAVGALGLMLAARRGWLVPAPAPAPA